MSTTPNVVWDDPVHNVSWDETAPQSNIGPKKVSAPASVPGAQLMAEAVDKLSQWSNFTQEGRAQHPLQAAAGDFANRLKQWAVGGQGGGQDLKTGFLNNPVTSMLAPGSSGAPAAAEMVEAIPNVARGAANLVRNPTASISKLSQIVPNLVQKLTGTTPERIAELAGVENKVADAHAVAIQAESTAKAAAKAAFPEIQTPVELAPKYAQGGWQDGHFVTADELQPVRIPFRTAQEQYSQLALDARAAHIARMRGQITGFDEAAILAKKNALSAAMQTAAETDGKLPDYLAAKKGFMNFMNDFHNKGSAIEPLLEMKPDETSKIVSHFLNPDKGARAIETLQKYGNDTAPIEDLLSKGATPLKIDVNEAAKLRKVGQVGYGPLRLQESIDQAEFNRLPSSAQARLPAWAMRKTSDVPLLPEALQPNIPTRFLTKRLLESDAAQRAVRGGSIPLKSLGRQ